MKALDGKKKGSRSPRNSRSPKGNKGEPDTPKASPAVCLSIRVQCMSAGAVKNSLMNNVCKCNYEWDTMFGCDHYIPKGIVAMPAKSEEYVDGYFEASIDCVEV